MSVTFGAPFTKVLVAGCRSLDVPVAWTLAKLALESGFDPFAQHPTSFARGLWQAMPTRARAWSGGAVPAGHIVRDGALWRLYPCPAPEVQLVEAFAFWRGQRGVGFRTREALYCCNLAPARLRQPCYGDDTIVYSADPDDEPLNSRGVGWERTYWPRAYEQNAGPFGLDPKDPRGKLRMRDLAVGLDTYVRRCQARYDAELAAALAFEETARAARDYVANVQPAALVERARVDRG